MGTWFGAFPLSTGLGASTALLELGCKIPDLSERKCWLSLCFGIVAWGDCLKPMDPGLGFLCDPCSTRVSRVGQPRLFLASGQHTGPVSQLRAQEAVAGHPVTSVLWILPLEALQMFLAQVSTWTHGHWPPMPHSLLAEPLNRKSGKRVPKPADLTDTEAISQ